MSVNVVKTLLDDETTVIEIIEGESKKNKGQKWRAIRLSIGDWSTLVFPRSKFEMEYIERLTEGL